MGGGGGGGEGGTGPTLVLYLRGPGATTTELWDAVAASARPMVGLPWAAVGAGMTAVAVVAGGAAAAAAGLGLELATGGGEDCFTLGRKLCPSRVFTMAGLEKERRWRG